MIKSFDFYEDPGHGWLRVPKALLDKLGITNKISGFSYMRGDWAYLEEDCDYAVFAVAMRDSGNPDFKVREHVARHQYSRIRNYERYVANI
jgi:hypothetical protein